VKDYAMVLNQGAVMRLVGASRREQRILADTMEALKADPFCVGDFQERDTKDRINEVTLVGDWLITYWSDHAARKIRIIEIEHIED
jgi:hypothetical protein